MICPYCGKEMREGFVQGARGLFFSEECRSVLFNPHKKKNDIVIANIFKCSAPAHYCDNCKCMIVKVDK